MSFEEIKQEILNLSAFDKKRLITEVVPQVWDTACDDQECAFKVKDLVDDDIVRPYNEMHMGGI